MCKKGPTSGPKLFYLPQFKIYILCECSVAQSCLTLCDPCNPPGSSAMTFSRQEHWSGLRFPTPGYLLHPGIEYLSPVSPALIDRFFTTEWPGSPFTTPLYLYPNHSPKMTSTRAPDTGSKCVH